MMIDRIYIGPGGLHEPVHAKGAWTNHNATLGNLGCPTGKQRSRESKLYLSIPLLSLSLKFHGDP